MKQLTFFLYLTSFLAIKNSCCAQTTSFSEHPAEREYISYRLNDAYADSILSELFDYLDINFPNDFFFIADYSRLEGENRDTKDFCLFKSEYKLNLDSIKGLPLDGNLNRALYMAQKSNRFFEFGTEHKIPVIFESDSFFGARGDYRTGMLYGIGCFTRFSILVKLSNKGYFTGLATAWEFRYNDGEKHLRLNEWSLDRHMLPNPYDIYHNMRQLDDSLRQDSLKKSRGE